MCRAGDIVRLTADQTGWTEPRPTRAHYVSDAADKLVLLGTGGGGNPRSARGGYANAIVVGDTAYVVDCGESANRNAWRSKITMSRSRASSMPGFAAVGAMFFTHLHADHLLDLSTMLLGFWPSHPVQIYGPAAAPLPIPAYPADREWEVAFPDLPNPGLRQHLEFTLRAFAYNINARVADEGRTNFLKFLEVHEIGVAGADIDLHVVADPYSTATAAPPMEPVVVHPRDQRGVQVSAVLVQHAPAFPALGYRFDTPAGAVAFSGDTGPCDNVVRLAKGADILVHEVIDVSIVAERVKHLPNREAIIQHLTESHTSPQDAGRIAAAAGVKTLVLSHLVPGDGEIPEQDWEAAAAECFDGEVICGVDLDQLAIGA